MAHQTKIPDDSFNANLTAIPKSETSAVELSGDPDLVATSMDYGTMNEDDAKDAGYINEKGEAVSKARSDKQGSPTGAYTDIGAGRSSAVSKPTDTDNRH